MKKLFSLVLIILLAMGFTRAQVTTLFSENFANGIPASWYNGGTSQGTANRYVKFYWTDNQQTGSPYNYQISQGVITSPTRSNGYIMFDSDSLDAGSTGTMGSGPAPVPQIVTLAPPGINVAGYPKLRLEFYQYLSTYESSTYVAISPDSVNWTIDTLNSTLGVNAETPLASEKVDIDISSIVNGGNTVYIQFICDANYYFWDIDDISVTSLPNNDIVVTGDAGQAGILDYGFFYASIPLSEADSFAAVVNYSNTGGDAQPNVLAAFNFYENNNLIVSDTAPPVVSLPYATDSFGAVTLYTQGIGSYKVTTTVSSDSVNFDSTANRSSFSFAVTDTVFSISNSNIASNAYFVTRSLYSLNTQEGTIYELDNADTVTSITTAIVGGTGGTHAGAVITADIYPVTITGNTLQYSTTSSQLSTIPKTLTAAELTTGVGAAVKPITLQIDYHSGNAVLAPGLYWVAIGGTPAPGDSMVLMATTTYAPNGFPAWLDPQDNSLEYFSLTDAPYSNMNLGHAASLLWTNWTRNPSTSPVKATQNVSFTGHSDGSPAAVYTWTFYSDSDQYYFPADTGAIVTTSFPPSGNSITGKDIIRVCVTVTDNGASAEYCDSFQIRPIGLGINEVAPLTSVSLVPNPTTGMVNLNAANVNGPVSISVINMLGEVVNVFNEDANGNLNKSYDLSALSNGIYLVKITNDNYVVTKKLSISKQ